MIDDLLCVRHTVVPCVLHTNNEMRNKFHFVRNKYTRSLHTKWFKSSWPDRHVKCQMCVRFHWFVFRRILVAKLLFLLPFIHLSHENVCRQPNAQCTRTLTFDFLVSACVDDAGSVTTTQIASKNKSLKKIWCDESEKQNKKIVIRLNKDTETYRRPAEGCRRMLHAFIASAPKWKYGAKRKEWELLPRKSFSVLFQFVRVAYRTRIVGFV